MTSEARQLQPSKTVLDHFQAFESFAKVMLDAYALLDAEGRVVKSNAMFSQLTGVKAKQIQKSGQFDQLLQLRIDDKRLTVADLLSHRDPTRIDEVRGQSNVNSDLNLIIGIYPFIDNGQLAGTFLLLRDVTAETNLQDKYKTTAMKSITDPLTGLFTRAYFEDFLELHVKTLNAMGDDSEKPALSLIIGDIDFFKKVNDVHGHQAGDYVIKTVAAVMKRTFRKTDVVCRYGGEEFLIILPATDLIGACHAANKMREAIQNEVFLFNQVQIPVTISSGVSQLNFPLETYMGTMARADEALYRSKKEGRNRVSMNDGDTTKDFLPSKD